MPGVTEWRHRVLARPLTTLSAYQRGEASLEDVQSAVDTAASVLESPDAELSAAMRQAEADIESIRFTVSEEDQRAAAASRVLDPLRARIELALR
jgi:hypothetical protein